MGTYIHRRVTVHTVLTSCHLRPQVLLIPFLCSLDCARHVRHGRALVPRRRLLGCVEHDVAPHERPPELARILLVFHVDVERETASSGGRQVNRLRTRED